VSTIQATVVLLDEQIQAFHRDGYLRLDALTTPAEVQVLRGVYDRLFARTDGFADGDQLELGKLDEAGRATLSQILEPQKYAPELVDTQARANALAIARQLLGTGTKRAGDHAIMKPAGHGAATPWHQDEAYWSPAYDHSAVSFWMPLQEATLENGCMRFVPGSHALDVVPHRLADPTAHALEVDSPVDDRSAVACPLPPGGCTIHHCRTLHYAGPNRSGTPRRAYIMAFAAAPAERETPHDYYWQRPEWNA
jgi:ectoine hydroxylase-related dioxygenase (phytanoyl-CoA dioxygenase family)